MCVRGRQITSTHVSLLVFGIFNAAIQDEHLMPEFQYDKDNNQWFVFLLVNMCWTDRWYNALAFADDTTVHRSGDRVIKEGDEMGFYVQQ